MGTLDTSTFLFRMQALAAFQALSLDSAEPYGAPRKEAAEGLRRLLGADYIPVHPGVFAPGASLVEHVGRLNLYLAMAEALQDLRASEAEVTLVPDDAGSVYQLYADGRVVGADNVVMFTVLP